MEIEKSFEIIVRCKRKNNFFYDKERKAYIVEIDAVPEKGKANAEIVKFLSKKLNKKVRIKTGLKSKRKIIEIIE